MKEDFIDPAGREARERARKKGEELIEDELLSEFAKFEKNFALAKNLHDLICDKYHRSSYVYYAADPKQLAWNEVHWKSEKSVGGDLKTATLGDDDFNGTLSLAFEEDGKHRSETRKAQPSSDRGMAEETSAGPETSIVTITGKSSPPPPKKSKYRFQIQKAAGPGDGTVPEESGAAPTPHVVQIFRHEGKEKGHESYDHQNSYKAKIAQAATLYSIVKIVAESEWVQQNLCKA